MIIIRKRQCTVFWIADGALGRIVVVVTGVVVIVIAVDACSSRRAVSVAGGSGPPSQGPVWGASVVFVFVVVVLFLLRAIAGVGPGLLAPQSLDVLEVVELVLHDVRMHLHAHQHHHEQNVRALCCTQK
jgi:hypothetical protein